MHKVTRSRGSSARKTHRTSKRIKPGRVDALLPRKRIAALARETQFTQRQYRKVAPMAFMVAVVFGYGVETVRSMSSLQRFFTSITKIEMARSAFQKKFSQRSVAFFRRVFQESLVLHAGRLGTRLGGKLARFRDVCAIDATVIRLHDFLEKKYAATRTNHTKAAAKLHAVLSLSKRTISEMAISAERVGDREFLKTLTWLPGRLLLFDLGYYAHDLFCAINLQGGLFLSRLKDSANPTIVRVRCGIARGQRTKGKKLWEVEFAPGRPVDLDVCFGKGQPSFRLVGVFNPERTCWHLYVTNLPADEFSPAELATIYRLRWEVELLFKQLKGSHRLEEFASAREEVVITLLYAALLALLASRVLASMVEQHDERGARRISLRIVSSYLIQHALMLATALLRGGRGVARHLAELAEVIGLTCRDPNPQRPSVLARLEAGT